MVPRGMDRAAARRVARGEDAAVRGPEPAVEDEARRIFGDAGRGKIEPGQVRTALARDQEVRALDPRLAAVLVDFDAVGAKTLEQLLGKFGIEVSEHRARRLHRHLGAQRAAGAGEREGIAACRR